LRLLAEGFTAGISGGGFLTNSIHYVFASFFGNDLNILPTWWAYSIALGLFFFAMPFSRYMHIVTETVLILFRNAGLKVTKPRKGFAEAEIYSCPGCGLCIDACPMNVLKKNVKYSSVYFIRFLRRHNTRKINEIAQKCLMCGKCSSICPVSIDSCGIRQAQRETITNILPYDYGFLKKPGLYPVPQPDCSTDPGKEKVLYFAGCMTHLTPAIIKAMTGIFDAAGTDYYFADENGGLCCGRPLMLAGKTRAAREVIEANTKMIMDSGCNTMILNCPICLKIFREEYSLKGIRILHHSEYIEELIQKKRINVKKNNMSYVYHDPCELGRGCGIYEPPRNIIKMLGELKKAGKERKESICCGGSLGSITLNYHDRNKITEDSLDSLIINNPENIVTACPLCYKTFGNMAEIPVMDLAQAVNKNIIKNKQI
jgi:Fe-S oxidoreductase